MLDPSLIILIGFLLFMSLAFRFGYRKSMKALDLKIEEIKNILESAEHARVQGEFEIEKEKSFANQAHTEITSLKDNVTHQIADIQRQATQELDHLLASKSENAKLVLDRLRTQAVQQLKEEITHTAVHLIHTLTRELKPADQENLNQHFIDMLDQVSNNPADLPLKKKLDFNETSEKQAINY